jgi:hypothetical protein
LPSHYKELVLQVRHTVGYFRIGGKDAWAMFGKTTAIAMGRERSPAGQRGGVVLTVYFAISMSVSIGSNPSAHSLLVALPRLTEISL